MSQITSQGSGGGGSGSVQFVTGNNGMAFRIHPTAGNINIIGSGTITANGDSVSTLTITDASRTRSTVTTTDATPTALYALDFTALPNNAATIFVELIAAQDNMSAGATGVISAGARNIAGPPVQIGIPNINLFQDFSSPVAVDALVVGNSLEIVVTGLAATTIIWSAIINIAILS